MNKTTYQDIQNLVNQIETHLDQDFQVLELSKQFGLSPWYFQRVFKGIIGDSLGSYVRGRRLTKAAQLIKQTNKGLIDIAIEVGFNSHEAFSRSFKSYFEVSPSDFRESESELRLKEKPILTGDLIHFLGTRLNKEPEIKILPTKRIIGYTLQIDSPFIDPILCTTIAEPWMKLLKKLPHFNFALKDVELYGVTLSESGNFTEDSMLYIAGIDVGPEVQLLEGMVEHIIPSQKVAIFEVATNVVDDSLKRKIDAIYGYWLINSKYERGNGNDYEHFKNMVDPMTGKFDSYYVIPLK